MTCDVSGDEELVRALHVYDDGRDWTAWLVWSMNSRRRLSEKIFALPPERPQVMRISIKPKRKPRRRKNRHAAEVWI